VFEMAWKVILVLQLLVTLCPKISPRNVTPIHFRRCTLVDAQLSSAFAEIALLNMLGAARRCFMSENQPSE
jgi:hypothetical protein